MDIIISDIHVGSEACQARALIKFLNSVEIDKLIINGDLFDSFNSYLKKSHWKILGTIRKLSKKTEVIWVKGNHDDIIGAQIVSQMIGATLVEEYIWENGGKKILAIHGDKFDNFLTDHPWLTEIADWIYNLIQRFDKRCSIVKYLKHGAKKYLRMIDQVEKKAKQYCIKKGCDIVCCGHVHYGQEKVNYFNSGCWTEDPCSYLVVKDGKVKIIFVSY